MVHRTNRALVTVIALIGIVAHPGGFARASPFIRGDANGDGTQDVSDPIAVLTYLFLGGTLDCLDAADVDDDGQLVLTDAVCGLGYQFLGGPPPPPPFSGCGFDMTPDGLSCVAATACSGQGTLSYEDRMLLMGSIRDRYEGLAAALSPAEARAAILADMASMDFIEASSLGEDGTTIGWKTAGGELHLFYTAAFDDFQVGAGGSGGGVPAGGAVDFLPHAASALVLAPWRWDILGHTLGGVDEAGTIAGHLGAGGYQTVLAANDSKDDRTVTLDHFRSFGSFGVIVLSTHGGAWSGDVYASTGVPVTKEMDACLKDPACKDRDLVPGIVHGAPGAPTYSISPAWVKEYYPTGLDRTLIVISACSSLANDTLKNALTGSGSGYFGWKDKADPTAAAAAGIGLFAKLLKGSKDCGEAIDEIAATPATQLSALCGGDAACEGLVGACLGIQDCAAELGTIPSRFSFAGERRLRLVEEPGCGDGPTSFLESWEVAPPGAYAPASDLPLTFVDGDAGKWIVLDTVSNFPDCGPTPHRAEIIARGGGKALRLVSVDTATDCADNIWVHICEIPQIGVNPGFSVPLFPDSMVTFEETGELIDPQVSWPNCALPPCGDAVTLLLADEGQGVAIAYVFQRNPALKPRASDAYQEFFLDPAGGAFTRNLFEDFNAIPEFEAAGAAVTLIKFEVNHHGTAVIDEIRICRKQD